MKNIERLDKLVEEWTEKHTPEEIQDKMQAVGIAAGAVKSGQDLDSDPQLQYRHYYWTLDHPDIGEFTYTGMPSRMSETPYEMKRAPMLGEHTEYVCTKLLGMSDQELVELMAEGVFE